MIKITCDGPDCKDTRLEVKTYPVEKCIMIKCCSCGQSRKLVDLGGKE